MLASTGVPEFSADLHRETLMPDLKVTGPKGGTIIKRAKLTRVRRLLPGLVKRFGKVTVAPAPPLKADRRALIVKWALRGVQQEPMIHYEQIRPMPLTWTVPPSLTTDCSGFATLCYKLAGAPDPNGLGYNGRGYTGTLLTHGKSTQKPQPADLVFFGPEDAEHVCIVVEAGADPLLVSHGQEAGPITIRLSAEAKAHTKPVRYRTYSMEGL